MEESPAGNEGQDSDHEDNTIDDRNFEYEATGDELTASSVGAELFKDLFPELTNLPTTTEILKVAVDADMIPSHPLTRQHFGFSKVTCVEEESCLLGLYQGLFMLPSPPRLDRVQGWVKKDKLAGAIYSYYKSNQAHSGYFR